ncbi:MAG: PQQ-dependent sugar dehydrogenase [Phycisphaerales bacterium]
MRNANLVIVTAVLTCAGGGLALAQPAAPAKPAEKPAAPAAAASAPAYKVETIADNLSVPWDMCWDHTGRMLFTERGGKVRQISAGKLDANPVFTVGDIRTGGEIGLMGICLHPDFKTNGYIYIAYGHKDESGDSPSNDVRVVRLKEAGGKITQDKVILSGIPATARRGSNHAGCSVRFGPDGKLYISTGERFEGKLAQDMNSLGGKILRVNDDGSIPADNPFAGKPNTRGEIWAFGIRNSQGIDWQPGTNLLFETEHGPSSEYKNSGGHDEFNLIEKGKNYGWPVIAGADTKEGMEMPLIDWAQVVAPASCKFYNADKFPQWKGRVLVGALGGIPPQRPGIIVITLDGKKVANQERIVTDMGRIRAVNVGPDGYIYFSTSNKDGRNTPGNGDDRICRLVPPGAAAAENTAKPETKPAAAAGALASPTGQQLGSKENPVKCDMPEGERAYLTRLRGPNGEVPKINRRGSTGKGPDGHIMDIYIVVLGKQQIEVYMDMYHPGHVEEKPIDGLTLVKE